VPNGDTNGLARELLEIVDGVFGGSRGDLAEKALVLMLSVCFIKRNLLHGAKSADSMNDQLENLDISSQSIAALLNIFELGFV